MAIKQTDHHQQTQQQTKSFLLDALYCEEEQWEGEEEEEEKEEEGQEALERESNMNKNNNNGRNSSLLLEQDLFWEDEELLSLFSKEEQTHLGWFDNVETDSSLLLARKEAVEWILKVDAHYGFSTLTAILAINYIDRFLFSLHFQKDKPWMIQLSAVTCLSLAAKVEETQVPHLLDLQVEGTTEYAFEPKTIQQMELLVLSTLQWRMNPVTPLSFLDHITRRLGLKIHLHWEFLRRCESLLLFLMADWRFVRYLPSVLATATMLHVIHKVEPRDAIDYQNQLLGVLKISKEKVDDCYKLILGLSNTCFYDQKNPHKRKHQEIPGTPSGVFDVSFSSDSSNDSWAVGSPVCSSPQPLFKKRRVQEQQMRLPSLSRVFVDVVGRPR
ncbi:unnamed protein product [Ilex paraguariensis]|uniref:B-like cyclin n=1 Tax=Ilex paraguariensis TaxID=185542 RepID=A0ABC8RLV9_9AQUA